MVIMATQMVAGAAEARNGVLTLKILHEDSVLQLFYKLNRICVFSCFFFYILGNSQSLKDCCTMPYRFYNS